MTNERFLRLDPKTFTFDGELCTRAVKTIQTLIRYSFMNTGIEATSKQDYDNVIAKIKAIIEHYELDVDIEGRLYRV